jgi:hypothetical protein
MASPILVTGAAGRAGAVGRTGAELLLNRAGPYDRMSDDALTLTGQGPLSVQEFVRKNAATFTPSAKEA